MNQDNSGQFSEHDLISITQSPGAQYLLAGPDKIIFECNSGFANIQGKIYVSSATTFNNFSVTKTATAAAILKLIEQKMILLSDFVNPVLDEFQFEYPFTVQQLLSHQAGFADPIPISWIHLASEQSSFDEAKFISQIINKNSKQKFRPGQKFSYSSIGYLILSRIIEKISGESYRDFIRKKILPALNVNSHLDFSMQDESHHATGYHPRFSFSNLILGYFLNRKKFIEGNYGSWLAFNNFYVNGSAYGGFIGNVMGLASYLQQYLNNKMFEDRETQKLMFTEQKGGMSLGWFIGSLSGEKYVCHAGGGGGYYCEIRIYSDLKLASVLLRNKSSFGDLRLLDKIDSKIIFK